jgi:hypothetical protein
MLPVSEDGFTGLMNQSSAQTQMVTMSGPTKILTNLLTQSTEAFLNCGPVTGGAIRKQLFRVSTSATYRHESLPWESPQMFGNNHRSDLFDFVRVWNKMFVDASSEGAYAEVGSFVEYHSPRNKSKSSKLEIGKLVWMISVFGRQVVIIHKMREVPMKGGPQRGEGFVDQFVRQEEAAAIAKSNRTKAAREFQMDPLKRCFWTLQQLEDDVPSNFDVIILPDSSDDPFPIVSIVMLQPDFSSITMNPNGNEYPKRWFLVEYVLL